MGVELFFCLLLETATADEITLEYGSARELLKDNAGLLLSTARLELIFTDGDLVISVLLDIGPDVDITSKEETSIVRFEGNAAVVCSCIILELTLMVGERVPSALLEEITEENEDEFTIAVSEDSTSIL